MIFTDENDCKHTFKLYDVYEDYLGMIAVGNSYILISPYNLIHIFINPNISSS